MEARKFEKGKWTVLKELYFVQNDYFVQRFDFSCVVKSQTKIVTGWNESATATTKEETDCVMLLITVEKKVVTGEL